MHALLLAVALAAPPATLEEKIAAALRNHPDVKAAEAKKLLAEAELEQAKLAVAQRVAGAVSKVELAKAKLIQAEEEAAIAEKILTRGAVPIPDIEKVQLMKARPALVGAKAELAAAELELQQLIGRGTGEPKPADKPDPVKTAPPTDKVVPSGPVAERLETALHMQFKLDFKDMEVKKAFEGLMTAAKLDDVALRGTKMLGGDMLKSPPKFDKLSGQNNFDGWVQLFLDELNANQDALLPQMQGKYEVYVREYGLLVERVVNAPKDAVTLSEFARAVRAKQK